MRIESFGGGVRWGKTLQGDSFVFSVSFFEERAANVDALLDTVAEFGQLQVLSLNGSRVTDAGLKHLNRLNQLRELNLFDTEVTDAGLCISKG